MEEQMLLKCLRYLEQSIHSVQSLSKYHQLFHRAGTNDPRICIESEKTLNNQRNIEKENQSWWHHNSRLQALLQSCSHQDSMGLTQKQTHRSMEQKKRTQKWTLN